MKASLQNGSPFRSDCLKRLGALDTWRWDR